LAPANKGLYLNSLDNYTTIAGTGTPSSLGPYFKNMARSSGHR